MKKKGWSAWAVSILAVCSFLLFGACGFTMENVAKAANLPASVTVSTGLVAVKMCLAANGVGEIDSFEFGENMQESILIDGVDMIHFERLDGDGGDGEFVPFYFRCDKKAWQICSGMLELALLEDCSELEFFVGELPVEEYTVTYSWGEEFRTVTVSDGDYLEEWIPSAPEGERFSGWYDGEMKYDFNAEVHRNMTLTAKFDKMLCQLTYVVDGSEWVTETYEYGAEIELKHHGGKDGHRFVGWESSAGIVETKITVTKDICLHAVWMKIYTVSFYVGDDFLESVVVDEGETVTPIPAPEQEGREFLGWYCEEEPYDFSVGVCEDTVLEAKYEELHFHVDFYIHGEIYFSDDCAYLNRLELFTPPPIKGETFGGWCYEDGSLASEGDLVRADLKLTAVYEKTRVKIRFTAEGNSVAEVEAVYGEPCVLPEAPDLTGYRFVHWSEKENGEEYEFALNWEEERERDFYAVYVACGYTVTYLSEHATLEGPTAGKYKEQIVFSVLLESGFKISKLEINRNGAWEELEDCTFIMPAGDVQIRVTTEVYTYFLEVVAEGKTYRVERGVTFLPPTPVRENENFLGWFTDPDFLEEYTGIATGEEGERIYLYAKFEKVKFTITFRAGEREERVLCEYGETPVPPFVPWEADTSKRFLKWSPLVATATENVVYVAVYESLYTKIYFDNEKEIFRETVALRESNAPIFVREGYLFEGYELERQESDVLYYYAKFSEIPKIDEPLNTPTEPDAPTISPSTDSTATPHSDSSSGRAVWILLTVLSVGAWVIYIGFRIYRRRNKFN